MWLIVLNYGFVEWMNKRGSYPEASKLGGRMGSAVRECNHKRAAFSVTQLNGLLGEKAA